MYFCVRKAEKAAYREALIKRKRLQKIISPVKNSAIIAFYFQFCRPGKNKVMYYKVPYVSFL